MNKKYQLTLNSINAGFSFLIMITLYLVLSTVGQAIISSFLEVGSALYIALCSLFSVLSMVITVVYFSKRASLSILKTCKVEKFNYKFIFLALFLSFGMFLGLGFIKSAFVSLLEKLNLTVPSPQIPLENLGHLLLFTLSLAILPAIFEEVFFRGFLLTQLSKVKFLYAVILISLSFSLYHCSLAQLIYQFIYGVGLILLCKCSGSIIPSIISHFLNNFIVLIVEYFKIKINLLNPFIIILGIILLAIFFILSLKVIKSKKEDENINEKVSSYLLFGGGIAMTICLVLAIFSVF